ncbi:MAG: hypothetical protein R2882_04940 [Gemmatimonadales bacterium]
MIDGRQPIEMHSTPSGGWSSAFRVSGDTFWRIDLETDDGRTITGLQYAVDALSRTGRPRSGSPIPGAIPGLDHRQVATEAQATGDFGVRQLTLHFSVNGGTDQVVPLTDNTIEGASGGSRPGTPSSSRSTPSSQRSDVAALLRRGDRRQPSQTGKSDLFFNIAASTRTTAEAEQQEWRRRWRRGGVARGSPSGSGRSWSAPSTCSATAPGTSVGNRLREDVTTLAIGEGRLREDVSRGDPDAAAANGRKSTSTFVLIARELDSAGIGLKEAEEALGRQKAQEAHPAPSRPCSTPARRGRIC